ncbi:MAG: polymer-forming cytoskeletal protein [Bacteroidota bacterium]
MKKQRVQPAFPPDVVTTIGTETVLNGGTLKVEHDLRVEGQLQCDVHVDGHVYIAEQASITGHVQAKSMHILGMLTGSAQVREVIRISADARVHGDVRAGRLAVDAGAYIEGQISMQGAPSRPIMPHQGDGLGKAVQIDAVRLAVSTGDGAASRGPSGDGAVAEVVQQEAVALSSPLAYEPPREIRNETDALMQFAGEPPVQPAAKGTSKPSAPAVLPTDGWGDWAEPDDPSSGEEGVDRFW